MTATTHQRHSFGSDGICIHCGVVRWKYLKQRRIDVLAKKKAADAIRRAKK